MLGCATEVVMIVVAVVTVLDVEYWALLGTVAIEDAYS